MHSTFTVLLDVRVNRHGSVARWLQHMRSAPIELTVAACRANSIVHVTAGSAAFETVYAVRMTMAVAALRTIWLVNVQCNLKHIKHKHVYFFWTVRDAEAVQYFNSTFAVHADLYTTLLFAQSYAGLLVELDTICGMFTARCEAVAC